MGDRAALRRRFAGLGRAREFGPGEDLARDHDTESVHGLLREAVGGEERAFGAAAGGEFAVFDHVREHRRDEHAGGDDEGDIDGVEDAVSSATREVDGIW